jgi:hypothetical protein
LVQAFLKKWWVESDFKAPNLPLSLLLKGSGSHRRVASISANIYQLIYSGCHFYWWKKPKYSTVGDIS